MSDEEKDETKEEVRSTGVVIWFNPQRGYGFIRDDEQSDDVFCHYSKIDAPLGEFRVLNSGDKVSYGRFVVQRGIKNKLQAKDVKILESFKQESHEA